MPGAPTERIDPPLSSPHIAACSTYRPTNSLPIPHHHADTPAALGTPVPPPAPDENTNHDNAYATTQSPKKVGGGSILPLDGNNSHFVAFPCPRIRQITAVAASFIENALPPIIMLIWCWSMLLALTTRNIGDHPLFKPFWRPWKRVSARWLSATTPRR